MLLTSPLKYNASPSIVRMSLYSYPVILAILFTWIFVVIAVATDKHCKCCYWPEEAGDRVVIPTILGTSFCGLSIRIYLDQEKVVWLDT